MNVTVMHVLYGLILLAKYWIFRILVAVLVLEIVHLGVQYAAPYIRPVFPFHF